MPHLRPGACTHARLVDASCQACEDICAEIAIFPAGQDLHLDPEACSGCGACVAACPQDALSQPAAAPVIAARRTGDVAVALCLRHPAAEGRPAAVCVHALGQADLAVLLAAGIDRLVLATGDCDACPIRPLTLIEDAVARLARLCQARGLLPLRADVATAADLALLPPADTIDSPSRRALFTPPPAAETTAPRAAQTLVALQRQGNRDAVPFAFSPAIQPDRCTGCDACLRVCPTTALTLTDAPVAYRADPARCTGCALCVDVCGDAAITVTPMAPAAPDVALSEWRCRDCGVPSHAPGAVPDDGLCRICRSTGHQKKLFQVLT